MRNGRQSCLSEEEMNNSDDYEPVLFVHDYWDCPRAGIAHYLGIPHRFACPFDDVLDDYPDVYLLGPISDSMLNLEREAWDIYYGHSPAPELSSILPKPIPRFPDAKPRYDEIQTLLENDRAVESRATIRASARFKKTRRPSSESYWQDREMWAVQWSALKD